MKIPTIKSIRNFGLATLTAGTLLFAPTAARAQNHTNDSFERTTITAQGTSSNKVLINAPDPTVRVLGENKTALFVVDITNNVLYEYDREGNPQAAYKIASGKKSTPTTPGVRIVSHTETYPYKSAPKSTKRYNSPSAYGPKIIYIKLIDPVTGEITDNGEFIHGNNDANSIGKHVSGGCIRMDNEVIKDLSQKVKRGDIIIIRK